LNREVIGQSLHLALRRYSSWSVRSAYGPRFQVPLLYARVVWHHCLFGIVFADGCKILPTGSSSLAALATPSRSPRSRSEPAHSSPSPQGQDALRRPQLAGRRQGRAAPPCNATRTTTAASLPAWKVSPPAHRLQNDRHLPQVLVLRGRRNATSGRQRSTQSSNQKSLRQRGLYLREAVLMAIRNRRD
jgi:hypothetical protein